MLANHHIPPTGTTVRVLYYCTCRIPLYPNTAYPVLKPPDPFMSPYPCFRVTAIGWRDAVLGAKAWIVGSPWLLLAARSLIKYTGLVLHSHLSKCWKTASNSLWCSQNMRWGAGCKHRDVDVSFDKLRVVLHFLTIYTHLAGHLSVHRHRIPPQRMRHCGCEASYSNPRATWWIYVYGNSSVSKWRARIRYPCWRCIPT